MLSMDTHTHTHTLTHSRTVLHSRGLKDRILFSSIKILYDSRLVFFHCKLLKFAGKPEALPSGALYETAPSVLVANIGPE